MINNTKFSIAAMAMVVSSVPSMVIFPTPSRQVTKASPPDSWVLISSPFANENRVILTAWFYVKVLLTTCPS